MVSVLVVGASGILAPAASVLAGRGHTVTGVARTRATPPDVIGLGVDARDEGAVAAALGERRWDTALVYEPAVTAASLRTIRATVDGRVVLVRTSAAADPAHGWTAPGGDTLVLGWHDSGDDVRWHSPQEVSDAALEVFADGRGRVLGVVRPWGRRP